MHPRPLHPALMTLGDALGHIAMAAAAGWLLRRVNLRAALRVADQRLPRPMVRPIERAAAAAAATLSHEAGRLGLETALDQEIDHDPRV